MQYFLAINNPAPTGGVFREETVSHSRVASERDVGFADASKVRRKRRGMRPEEIQALGKRFVNVRCLNLYNGASSMDGCHHGGRVIGRSAPATSRSALGRPGERV